jgi:hypothetical protein
MPLTKVTDCRFLNDNASAQRGAREQLKFILANGDKLLRLSNGKKYLITAKEFQNMKENFTPNQMSFIDGIYEKTMGVCGFDFFKVTFKPNKKRG